MTLATCRPSWTFCGRRMRAERPLCLTTTWPDRGGSSARSVALGGLATAHTPAAVRFYLDEAQKAQSVGANSAAVTMYRAAIEHVLFEQGFQRKTLGKKVEDLEAAIRGHTAPAWTTRLEVEDLALLKDLGNYSISPNDGDISKQATFDAPLLQNIQETVRGLLDLIYQDPIRQQERRDRLRAARV